MRLNNQTLSTILVLASLVAPAFCADSKSAAEAVAVVNNEAIPKSEFDRDWTAFAAQLEKGVPIEQVTPRWENERKRILLNQLIEQRLVLQEAKKKSVSVSQKDIDAVIARTKQRFQVDAQGKPVTAEEAQEAFQKELASENLTEKQFAKNIQNQLLAASLTNQLIKDKVKLPSDDDVRKLFEAVKERMAGAAASSDDPAQADLNRLAQDFRSAAAERVRVQRVLFALKSDATAAQSKAAQQKAKEAKAKLDKGADFADVAEQYSDDKRSAQAGGDIGYVRRGEVKDLDEVLFSTPVGGYSDVVKTKQGFQLFRIEEKRAASSVRFPDAKRFLTEHLVRSSERTEYARFVDGLKKSATIDIRASFAKL
jgi:parvulin-like peptidyl-prolyl isomerase